MEQESIRTVEDLYAMLDALLEEKSKIDWNGFYKDRTKKVPFFKNIPDENLVSYIESDLITAGKALELGCGPGRNAIYLAEKGFEVDAVDSSYEAIHWGKERSKKNNVTVNFIQRDIFTLDILNHSYDLVYDSGCLHHIAPHRRIQYLELLDRALKPGGLFAVTCFMEGGSLGGSPLSDYDVYKHGGLQGGIGFNPEKLKSIFQAFKVIEIRRMNAETDSLFGHPDLYAALFQKR
jgi:SAM-dependent methyltransferase